MKNRPKGAFTLIEILVVVVIIAILAAVVMPAIAGAKRSAHRTVAISNMRQTGLALTLYVTDQPNEWHDAPHYEAAKAAVAKAPTFDPLDHWRASQEEETFNPMLGSFAYFPGLHSLDQWRFLYRLKGPSAPVLASIFHAQEKPKKFTGNVPPFHGPAHLDYPKPRLVLTWYPDGRAAPRRLAAYPNLMTWDACFFGD
jgi:prepilin-type N-terminal cleavage/methylation domain-containing protein